MYLSSLVFVFSTLSTKKEEPSLECQFDLHQFFPDVELSSYTLKYKIQISHPTYNVFPYLTHLPSHFLQSSGPSFFHFTSPPSSCLPFLLRKGSEKRRPLVGINSPCHILAVGLGASPSVAEQGSAGRGEGLKGRQWSDTAPALRSLT